MQELNNVRMSDFQKIIFVNNIDENAENVIKNDNYNFAVFLTKTSNKPAGFNSNELINIWHQGQRLNRFIGIDPNHNYLDINNHIIKLIFNYETGMLSIIDANELDELICIGISYTPLSGDGDRIDIFSNEDDLESLKIKNHYVVDSKYNEFHIYLKFKRNEISGQNGSFDIPGTISYNATYNNINETDFINCESVNIYDNSLFQYNLNDNEIIYDYRFRIINDTYHRIVNNNNGLFNYTFQSTYDNSKSVSIPICTILNPISFTIYSEDSSVSVQDDSIYTYGPIRQYINYNIVLNDDVSYTNKKPFNYSEHILKFKIETDNTKYVNLVGDNVVSTNDSAYQIIDVNDTGIVNFRLSLCETIPTNNNTFDSNIKITLLSSDDNASQVNRYRLDYKQFTIKVSGNYDYKLYYFGHIDPRSTAFNIEYLMSYSDLYKGTLLYSWEANETNGEITIYPNTFDPNVSNTSLYFMIPASSNDLNLKYNIYEDDNSYIANNCNKRKYLPLNLSSDGSNTPLWKTVNSSFNLIYNNNNVTFKIYEFTGGVFHGKLQKDV